MTVFFAHLGSSRVKAASKMLVKLTLGDIFAQFWTKKIFIEISDTVGLCPGPFTWVASNLICRSSMVENNFFKEE